MENVTVADVMTRYPVTASPEDSLQECSKKMIKKNVNSLVLIGDKELKGFVTLQDIVWALVKRPRKELEEIKAKDISPRKIITIKPTANIKDAITKMNRTKFERLPVVQEKSVLGIITAKDILNFHPEVYPEIEEFSKIRDESEKLNRIKRAYRDNPLDEEGICEECGEQGVLYRFNGMIVCEDCMENK